MKKGKIRIIIGCVLIFIQILSILGNAKAGITIKLSFDNFSVFLYDLIVLLSYLSVGIIGVILLIWGICAYNKKAKPTIQPENTTREKQPQKTFTFTETSVQKDMLVFITNILSICFTIFSIVSIIVAMIVQDSRRNLFEDWNPTVVYLVLLFILSVFMCFAFTSLIKNRFKLIACLSFIPVIATIITTTEGSIQAYYCRTYGSLVFYKNSDIVEVCNFFLIICVFLVLIITAIPVIIATIEIAKNKWYKSILYREKCYKRVEKMHNCLEKGIITEEEYEKNKNEILKHIK